MERTLARPFSESRGLSLLLAGLGVLAFFGGLLSDALDLRIVAMALFGVVAGLVIAAPYGVAIRILFVYLGFEGMAKLLSSYNPIVHVGADLLVITLVSRWLISLLLQRTGIPLQKPPFVPLFVLHFVWFLIEFANPYSLGLVPSLAGAKIYVTMVTLYAFGFYLCNTRRDVHLFMAMWVFTICVQLVTGLYQGMVGASSVLSLGPYYRMALAKFDVGSTFRPFGTTQLPGAPAVYIFMGVSFILYFMVINRHLVVKLFLAALLPAAALLLLLCQVRSALLKTILSSAVFIFLLLARASNRTRTRALLALPVLVGAMIYLVPELTNRWVEERPDAIQGVARSLTLFNYAVVSHARIGVVDRIVKYATEVPLGAGISRTGAAAGKFEALVLSDPYFSNGFFTDNFWAATIAEMGLPGSLILTCIIFGILIKGALGVFRTSDPDSRALQAALLCPLGAIVVGLWGAEGLLYNPEAAFFWFFSGALMRLGSAEPVEL